MIRLLSAVLLIGGSLAACQQIKDAQPKKTYLATLMTLDPGHFHSALVQKNMYPEVDTTAYVYAPAGDDVQMHLSKIEQYNNRADNPTNWNEVVYTGPDFAEKMFEEKPGNVMVVAGNNQKKTNYILRAVQDSIHVYADKPMAINGQNYETLKEAFDIADKNGVLIYDIMTERFEITTILQRRLSQLTTVFGEVAESTPDTPAITKESVHHFSKMVSGSHLIRPAWFFDIDQQGAGIVDVSTHLVDLIMWSLYPKANLKPEDAEIVKTRQWSTDLTPEQFKKVTGLDEFPGYLKKDVLNDSVLQVYSNGEIVFKLREKYGKSSVIWNFEAPPGSKDTHFSRFRGTKSDLVIRQDSSTNFQPTLFIEPHGKFDRSKWEMTLNAALDIVHKEWPNVDFHFSDNKFIIDIPDKYKVGHEAHFTQVTKKYLDYLKNGSIPQWEKDFMLTKYYITTKAYEDSLRQMKEASEAEDKESEEPQ
ncbi:Gfo/Idh/MocA family oxidoreductase [Membranicola marinus]|uniref:Gfo/Idh/MocA family oxidoreductase n=1 Tax=Membranihabitans marinus TaxID=1227546 RepID=A0A953L6K5_9BACT|nr:putative oxidoreductase C-terminal domain-containing protein [Membranihabitans marinus]MBY5957747.1 Gfo/Idh/MocA family oxidoreductase [Membranihabitans marinus]